MTGVVCGNTKQVPMERGFGDTQTGFYPRNGHRAVGLPCSLSGRGASEILRPVSPLLMATGLWVCLAASVEDSWKAEGTQMGAEKVKTP